LLLVLAAPWFLLLLASSSPPPSSRTVQLLLPNKKKWVKAAVTGAVPEAQKNNALVRCWPSPDLVPVSIYRKTTPRLSFSLDHHHHPPGGSRPPDRTHFSPHLSRPSPRSPPLGRNII
jgi:hypothetical protein